MIEYYFDRLDGSDYERLFATTGWNQSYRADRAELAKALSGSWTVIAAFENGQCVGCGRVVSDGVLYAMIYDLIVAPTHRCRGIGSAMLTRLVARCETSGIRDIQLFSAKGKASFYQARGFVPRPKDAPGMRWAKP